MAIFFFFSKFLEQRNHWKEECHYLLLPKQSLAFKALQTKAFDNIVRKGENAGNQHSFLFPTMFSSLSETEIIM